MKIKSITIHNFRSIREAKLELSDYAVLIGANNAGKSNILTALRIFYEDGIKFNEKTDFPKFSTDDSESWIEIEYALTDHEFDNLKNEYKSPDKILRVRKYLKSKDNRVKSNQSNIYAYENGTLSNNLFYGAKNVSEAKLGSVIYIPEITKTEDTLKLTGPSPLRDLITFIMKKVAKTSSSFEDLTKAFEEFNNKFKNEVSGDGFSLNMLKKEINDNLKEWGIEFKLDINPVRPEDIIKNLVSHTAIDKSFDKEVEIKNLGQGLQRHLIYTLLKLSAKYTDKKSYAKKEFSPELTLILFEEPEAFLHPGQQEFLNFSLKSLSQEEDQQIIISTHSPIFVSKNIDDIPSLIRLKRENGVTNIFQVSESAQRKIISENNELVQMLANKLSDRSIDDTTKNRIKKILGDTDDAKRMEEEAIRYLLWLDNERCAAFFAEIVLICEGASEKTFIDYLIKNNWGELREKKIYILDALGKFNIHRYMNLFKELGIYHSVLADRDENNNVHQFINNFINSQRNGYTKEIDFFDKDIETFLEIPYPTENRKDKKPLNIMWHFFKGNISNEKLNRLKEKVENLL